MVTLSEAFPCLSFTKCYALLYKIQVSKGHKPLVLAQWWFNDVLTCHNMSIKAEF